MSSNRNSKMSLHYVLNAPVPQITEYERTIVMRSGKRHTMTTISLINFYVHFVFPALVTAVVPYALPMGFDLPQYLQTIVQSLIRQGMYALPLINIDPLSEHPDRGKPLEDEQATYFWSLVELATLLLGRKMRQGDFKAVTDAMHRRFEGGVDYLRRGYNNFDSFAKNADKKSKYNLLLLSILGHT
ncbi:hypothetical protein DL98DRAFT_509935 [Cadophora sp. DSE1049]|nr:hypothetical protein DL98DRAFT_509935 [Cadophora sp. DSE1049]